MAPASSIVLIRSSTAIAKGASGVTRRAGTTSRALPFRIQWSAGYSLDLDKRIAARTIGQERVAKEMRGAVIRFVQDPLGLASEKGGVAYMSPREPLGMRLMEDISTIGA
jgi:hypothetical protein